MKQINVRINYRKASVFTIRQLLVMLTIAVSIQKILNLCYEGSLEIVEKVLDDIIIMQ